MRGISDRARTSELHPVGGSGSLCRVPDGVSGRCSSDCRHRSHRRRRREETSGVESPIRRRPGRTSAPIVAAVGRSQRLDQIEGRKRD